MQEAISKYTALEVLHVVGPPREETRDRRPEPARHAGPVVLEALLCHVSG